jgi:antitoxin ParD1/3/4
MSGTFNLGEHFDAFIQDQRASGHYSDASQVLRDTLRLMEERERRLAALDLGIERGMADIKAGRVHGLDDVCDELAALPDRPAS